MRKILLTALAVGVASLVFAQKDSTVVPKKKVPEMVMRPGDHFLLQFGYTSWTNKSDSIHTKGFPHNFNAYIMFDFPFKTNPKLSLALGPGISTDNMYFDKMYVGLKDPGSYVQFRNVSDTEHFKKYKMEYAFVEAPIELRYRSNPASDAKSFKVALGVKVGYLLEAHVKGKNLESSSGVLLNPYIDKEKSDRYLNTTRFMGSIRVGYSFFSVYAQYALTPIFKEGAGPKIQPLNIGLTLSGL